MTFTELEQAEALKYLFKWLQNHPKYGVLTPPGQADSLYYADVSTPDNHVQVLFTILSTLRREMRQSLQFLSVIFNTHEQNFGFQRARSSGYRAYVVNGLMM